jgi:hypothetical protein
VPFRPGTGCAPRNQPEVAVAPEWTPTAIDRTKAWFGCKGRKVLVHGLLLLGPLLIVCGVIALIVPNRPFTCTSKRHR